MIGVFKYPILLKTAYSKPDYQKSLDNQPLEAKKVKIEGIYMFGGKDSLNRAKNDLVVVQLGSRPLLWSTVDT